MSGILDEILDDAQEIGEAVVGEAESLFRPRPGGKIDTDRRQRDADSLDDEPVAAQDYLIKGRPVAVDSLAPDTGTARTVTLSANNPVLPILPRDTTRRSAVILAVDADIYLSASPGSAANAAATGGAAAEGVFYLPAGTPVPWQNTDQLWAAATTTASASRISVMASFKGAK